MQRIRARSRLFGKMDLLSRLAPQAAMGRLGDGSFRAPASHSPGRVCARITALQAVFCGSLLFVGGALRLIFGRPHALATVVAQPRVSALGFWRALAVLVLQGGAGALTGLSMGAVVQRSRQCFDYGVTVALLHGAFSLVTKGPPRSAGDFLFGSLAFTLVAASAVLIGRRACVRAELLPIPLGQSAPSPSITDGSIIWAVGEMLDKRPAPVRSVLNTAAPNAEPLLRSDGAAGLSDGPLNV